MSLNPSDQKFVQDAIKGGEEEVALGHMAASKGSSQKVKDFGNRMVTDHSKAGGELKALAIRKGWSTSASAPESHADLESKSGADFDKTYATMMVQDHEKDVAEFEKAAQSASDPDLKAFAAKTLPTLKEHLAEARSLP